MCSQQVLGLGLGLTLFGTPVREHMSSYLDIAQNLAISGLYSYSVNYIIHRGV